MSQDSNLPISTIKMLPTCFPTPEIAPVNPPFVASPKLADVPTLAEEDELLLDTMLQRLRLGEAVDDDAEAAVETIENEIDVEVDVEDILENGNIEVDLEHPVPEGILIPQFILNARNSTNVASKRANTRSKPSIPKKARLVTPKRVTIVSRVTPVKPPNHKKNYRVISLSNGLRAVLIQKPLENSKKSKKERLDDFMDSISTAFDEGKKFQENRMLPENFPQGFPLANLSLAQPLTDIIQEEMEKVMYGSSSGSTAETEETIASKKKDSMDQTASFAVVINVGALDTPWNCLGLAHFLEHMVHYGSEKYPGEEAYFTYAINHSRGFNAFTENHTTTYFNTVPSHPADTLTDSLDMLTSMLSKPTFGNDMTLREVNAVDSEFFLKSHFEFLRRFYLLQHILDDHPVGKFGCGNEETLLEPKDIHKTLRDFHSKNYVASAMTVGFESILDLDDQEELILEFFSDLPKGNRGILRETPPNASEKRIGGKRFNMDYVMQGLCSFSNLWLVWPIPEAFLTTQGNKSMALLLKVLGDQGEGSLAHYLRTKHYIWLMICNSPVDAIMNNKYTTFLTIDFFLTPEGESHVSDIMQATYSFLDELADLPEEKFEQVFNEMKMEIGRDAGGGLLGGRFTMFPGCISLAKALQSVEPENILKTDHWTWQNAVYHQGEVGAILDHLVPTNMIVIQTLPSTTNVRNYLNTQKVSIEPYSKGEYVVQGIRKRFGNLERTAQLNFEVLEETKGQVLANVSNVQYEQIRSQQLPMRYLWGAKVIHGVHLGSKKPTDPALCAVNYINSRSTSTAKNCAMSLLWITSNYLALMKDMTYLANGLFILVPHWYGITIGVLSPPGKMLQNISKLNSQFFTKPLSPEEINTARAALMSIYDLLFAANSAFISQDLLHFMTCNHSGDVLSNAVAHIRDCSAEEVNDFGYAFKTKTMALIIFGGNVSVRRSYDIVDVINSQGKEYACWFGIPRLFFSEYFRSQPCYAYKNPAATGERCIRLKSDLNYGHTTTVQNLYYVGYYDPAKYILWWNSLFFLQLRSFIELRMKQQLGYAIQVFFPKPEQNHPMVIGVSVIATARKFTPCHLDKSIDEFMVDYGNFLATVDEKTFKELKLEHGYEGQVVNVRLSDARSWYQEYFGDTFASDNPNKFHLMGMCKISFQLLGNASKPCSCEICNQIAGWRRVEFWNHFQFARGKESLKNYFVDNPTKLHDGQSSSWFF